MALRPKTLSAAVVPILVGSALAIVSGLGFNWWLSLSALISTLFIQIGTNLINDAIDFKKGADTEKRTGPVRMTQSGMLSSKSVMIGAIGCLFLAALFGVPLVLKGGVPIIIIGVFSLFLAYSYTGGPFPLAYLGLGDVFVLLFFGLIAVGGLFYIHTEELSVHGTIAGLQVGLLATVLIAINNLRDSEQDREVDKRTLAVRFGKAFVLLEIYALNIISFLLLIYWIANKMWFAGLLPLMALPLSLKVMKGVVENEPGPIYNSFLSKAGIVHLVFGGLLALGIVLGEL